MIVSSELRGEFQFMETAIEIVNPIGKDTQSVVGNTQYRTTGFRSYFPRRGGDIPDKGIPIVQH